MEVNTELHLKYITLNYQREYVCTIIIDHNFFLSCNFFIYCRKTTTWMLSYFLPSYNSVKGIYKNLNIAG